MPLWKVEEKGGLYSRYLYSNELTRLSHPTGVIASFASMYFRLAFMNLKAKNQYIFHLIQ